MIILHCLGTYCLLFFHMLLIYCASLYLQTNAASVGNSPAQILIFTIVWQWVHCWPVSFQAQFTTLLMLWDLSLYNVSCSETCVIVKSLVFLNNYYQHVIYHLVGNIMKNTMKGSALKYLYLSKRSSQTTRKGKHNCLIELKVDFYHW